MSLGIIVVMLAVLTILVWICVKKYNGLEEHARKLLDGHRTHETSDQTYESLQKTWAVYQYDNNGNTINYDPNSTNVFRGFVWFTSTSTGLSV